MGRRPAAAAGQALLLALLAPPTACRAEEGYPQGLLEVPKGGDQELSRFVSQNIEPRHAVAVGVTGKGSKRHKLLEDLAEDEELRFLLAMGVRFAKGGSSLSVHRFRSTVENYTGKWTRSAIRAWLQDVSYPLVNRMQFQFAPPKYLTETPYGAVLIVKGLTEQTDELISALEPFAEKYRDKLKFTFFTKAPGTQQLCDMYGVWSNDELLLLERPRERPGGGKKHSHTPPAAKFRLEGVTPASVESFFQSYGAGTLPRYYKSPAPRAPPVTQHGVRELTGWDFAETVGDPGASVLVEFVSAECEACEEFAGAYREVAAKVQAERMKDLSIFKNLIVARIDQSVNEHSELIKGTPWMRYWPRGRRKRPVDVDLRSVESIWDFLEERLAEEADSEPTAPAEAGVRTDGACSATGGATPGCSAGAPAGGLPPGPVGEDGAAEGPSPEGPRVVLGQPTPGKARGYLNTEMDLEEEELEAGGSPQYEPGGAQTGGD